MQLSFLKREWKTIKRSIIITRKQIKIDKLNDNWKFIVKIMADWKY
jgi:hypothetical protein